MSIIVTTPSAPQRGGAGTYQTWQQVLNNGSTLTQANTINGGGFDLTFDNVNRFLISTPSYIDGLFRIFGGQVNLGDFAFDVNGTSIYITDNISQIQAVAANGFIFQGGRISADSDLSLMAGSAGIFNDGSVIGYNTTSGNNTLNISNTNAIINNGLTGINYLSANENSLVASKNTVPFFSATNGDIEGRDPNANIAYFDVTNAGSLFVRDTATGNDTIFSNGDGDFGVSDKTTANVTFQTNGAGAIVTRNATTNNIIFGVDQFGLLTVNQSGTGLSSPWLLGGTATAGAAVLDATQYLEIKVGGIPYKLALIV